MDSCYSVYSHTTFYVMHDELSVGESTSQMPLHETTNVKSDPGLCEILFKETSEDTSLVFPAVLERCSIRTVVDTAAQVMVVSIDWIRKFKPSLELGTPMSLLNAAKGSRMTGRRLPAQRFSRFLVSRL